MQRDLVTAAGRGSRGLGRGDRWDDLMYMISDTECLPWFVCPQATCDELKAAYRRLCMLYHPDKHRDPELKSQAERLFNLVHQAYEGKRGWGVEWLGPERGPGRAGSFPAVLSIGSWLCPQGSL